MTIDATPVAEEPKFFQFEADFVESLRCIPMVVRLKLDTCGIKLTLAQWHHFNASDRQTLVEKPCHSPQTAQAYQTYLKALVVERTATPAKELPIDDHPAWMDTTVVPDAVQAKAQELELSVTVDQWANLSPLQRFALIKLSRASHENSNFQPALQEFGLCQA